eukprot:IDg2844t1
MPVKVGYSHRAHCGAPPPCVMRDGSASQNAFVFGHTSCARIGRDLCYERPIFADWSGPCTACSRRSILRSFRACPSPPDGVLPLPHRSVQLLAYRYVPVQERRSIRTQRAARVPRSQQVSQLHVQVDPGSATCYSAGCGVADSPHFPSISDDRRAAPPASRTEQSPSPPRIITGRIALPQTQTRVKGCELHSHENVPSQCQQDTIRRGHLSLIMAVILTPPSTEFHSTAELRPGTAASTCATPYSERARAARRRPIVRARVGAQARAVRATEAIAALRTLIFVPCAS